MITIYKQRERTMMTTTHTNSEYTYLCRIGIVVDTKEHYYMQWIRTTFRFISKVLAKTIDAFVFD